MFLIKDAIYAMWYTLGTFIVGLIWPDINKNLETAKSDIRNMEDQFRQETMAHQNQVDELITEYEKVQSILVTDYQDLEKRYGELFLASQKKAGKKKDPSKVTKPIKPRPKRAK